VCYNGGIAQILGRFWCEKHGCSWAATLKLQVSLSKIREVIKMDMATIAVLIVLWVCVLPLIFGDAITYNMARAVDYRTGSNRTANYFVAGILNQPLEAFAFMFDLPILQHDTIKLMPYSNRRAHVSKMADAILRDATEHHYQKVRIFTISVGTTVACLAGRRMTKYPGEFELECYLINPCPNAQFLKPVVNHRLIFLYPLMVILGIVLGPLAFVPLIPASGRHFSVVLSITQVEQILFGEPILAGHRQYVKGVVISDSDEFLDNTAICEFYADQQIIQLEKAKHSDTIGAADKYRVAIEQLLTNPHS